MWLTRPITPGLAYRWEIDRGPFPALLATTETPWRRDAPVLYGLIQTVEMWIHSVVQGGTCAASNVLSGQGRGGNQSHRIKSFSWPFFFLNRCRFMRTHTNVDSGGATLIQWVLWVTSVTARASVCFLHLPETTSADMSHRLGAPDLASAWPITGAITGPITGAITGAITGPIPPTTCPCV
ncbi:unnamed protein product [Arctogadus glacialis]